MKKLTIVGAGWAGLAAAVHAVQQGWQVRLLEAAPQVGGRARRIMHQRLSLDNGQHILIGAYRETLQMMRTVGIDTEHHLWRMPLILRRPDGKGLQLPAWPAPWNMMTGIMLAHGWNWRDKLSLVGHALRWRLNRLQAPPEMNVAMLCRDLPTGVMSLLIEPLCVSALNLPPEHASAQVFLRVMQDALLGGPGSSDLLIPRTDLSSLWPDAALHWLGQQGAELVYGCHVQSLDKLLADPVVLACPAWEAARLTADIEPTWSAQAHALKHTAITTVYLQANKHLDWPFPVMALQSDAHAPAQFAFDKSQLTPSPDMKGVLAMVVSASMNDRQTTTEAVLRQAKHQLGLGQASAMLTVVEKRAAFACEPGVRRPSAWVRQHLVACGDYIDGPYPATLEGAVQSGLQAVNLLQHGRMGENEA
ncbi:MAG: hydroxysqualene dehydroxylase HpnE [Limnohabitans sp.]